MRDYRARRRAAGLRLQRRWVALGEASAAIRTYSDHSLLDARSLAMHCVIAQKIAREPKLLQIAKRNLARWRQGSQPPAGYLAEWDRLLQKPLSELLGFITAADEQSARLRQSSPFAGVLNPQERKRIFEAFRA